MWNHRHLQLVVGEECPKFRNAETRTARRAVLSLGDRLHVTEFVAKGTGVIVEQRRDRSAGCV